MAAKPRVDFQLRSIEFSSTSSETFGRLRKRPTSSGGSVRKQSTLCQPCALNCEDSSRAKVSVPPIRMGSTPKTETTVGAEFPTLRSRFDFKAELLPYVGISG